MTQYAATFNQEKWLYVVNGQEIDELTAKAASNGVAKEFAINTRRLAQQLQNEQISLQQFYDAGTKEIKFMHMAQAAAARGGIEAMREEDWARVSEIVEQQISGVEGQYPGFRSFAEDIQKGRYGQENQVLSSAVLSRTAMYPNASRGTYENERLAAQMERFQVEAKRIKGFSDHCPGCTEYAVLGWIDAATMYEQYPIGSAECGGNCYCHIVTRRKAVDDAQQARAHWKGLPGILTNVARAGSATGAVAIVAFNLLRVARSNPTLVQIALKLLAGAIGV